MCSSDLSTHGSSYFQNAHHFNIENVTITETRSRPMKRLSRTPLEFLLDNMADGAVHNSAERSDAPKCHAETRVAVQEEILSWVCHGDRDARPTKVMWVTGPAGTGKTAIAGSVAEACEKQGLLAASFFFSASSKSANRRSKRCLVATLAYQLIQHPSLQGVGKRVLSAIMHDPAIFKRRLEDQLEGLILGPLRDVQLEGHYDPFTWPKAIVIDGLDECEVEEYLDRTPSDVQRSKEDDHSEILSLLLQAAQDPSFPFRIVLASRPEPVIRTFFFESPAKVITVELVLDQKYNPDADITLFLRSKFAELRRRYDIWDWPKEDVIKILVERASGQFIYAATIVRFIEGRSTKNRRRASILPQIQLDCVLHSRPSNDGAHPLAPLDALYTCILQTSSDPILAVKWIRLIDSMLRGHPAVFVKQFLESTPGEAECLLGTLSSLVFSPPSDGDSDFLPYHFYHKSLVDFLDDPKRCGELYVSPDAREEFYRVQYFRVLKDKKTRTPLSETEMKVFLERFFNWLDVPTALTEAEFASSENDLLACDVAWCVQTSYEAARVKEKRRFTALFFNNVHVFCHWYKCNPVCKHWRKNILKACKEQARAGMEVTEGTTACCFDPQLAAPSQSRKSTT